MTKFFTLALFVAGFPFALHAQAEPEGESIFDHLSQREAVIELILQTNMEELINNRLRENYQSATLIYLDEEEEAVQLEVDVIPRGKYRRRICDFPPIMLNFSKDYLAKKGLNRRYDKMKLVSHCQNEAEAIGHLLKEYLAYRIYSLISPNSYRVQLAMITYKDTEEKHKDITRYAALIEDTDEMAHRAGGSECECMNYPPDSIALAEENTMSVYQYMIGNEDWSIPMLRNVKLIRPYDGGRLIPVPYDFDFSGFVNASYAVPRSQLGHTDIRQRAFLGYPVTGTMLSETIAQFSLRQNQIIALIEDMEALSKLERRGAVKYIEEFFGKKRQRKLASEVSEKHDALKEGEAESIRN